MLSENENHVCCKRWNGLFLVHARIEPSARTSDTEVVLHLYARSTQKKSLDAIYDAIRKIEGACVL